MNGLGGLNKSPEGVVIGLVQLQLPVVATKADLARQTERIVTMVGKARRNLSTMDLVVFPEYSLHGLSKCGPIWCARRGSTGASENNIYQLWHRGYVAVKSGAMDCPYTFMQDMVGGTYRLPWEDEVKVTDGTSCGFAAPTRMFGAKTGKAAE